MNSEDNANNKQVESSSTDSQSAEQFAKIEGYLASIRAASWLAAVGILALVVTQVR